MAQGPRGGLVRAAFAGLGAVLCAGVLGCMNTDKAPVPNKYGTSINGTNNKAVTPGLQGAKSLPGQPGSGGVGLNNQPGGGNPAAGMGSGLQPAGGFGSGGMGSGTGAG